MKRGQKPREPAVAGADMAAEVEVATEAVAAEAAAVVEAEAAEVTAAAAVVSAAVGRLPNALDILTCKRPKWNTTWAFSSLLWKTQN